MPKQKNNTNKKPSNIEDALLSDIKHHIVSMLGNDHQPPRRDTYYHGLAYCVRDRLIERWLRSQRSYYKAAAKRVYYLSMEFLPGRFLKSYILNLDMESECRRALSEAGFSLEELAEEESDPGLGNGGLGRLASCYMDSLACLNIPSYGYGIRYDYGIFQQKIIGGQQVEVCDNWLRRGTPWEIARRNFLYKVNFYGRSEQYTDEKGNVRYRWADTEALNAMACDVLIPGHGTEIVNNMRLWVAMSSSEFNLEFYQHGQYMKAMEDKVLMENVSKVLYPSDEAEQGRELRLKQQYFFVAATFQDIMRRFKKSNAAYSKLPDLVAVQLNDTHPAISIAELMRILIDEEGLDWDAAWDICVRTFAYTNHTVLPEALETWPVALMARMLPRHMEIIFEINRRFLNEVAARYPNDPDRLSRMSLIQEGPEKKVRMAHLAVVGSHSVNGVAALHTRILKTSLFKDFDEFYPGKFKNITNGITQRRWLLQANPGLSSLITAAIGPEWVGDLNKLKLIIPNAGDSAFRSAWADVKKQNKSAMVKYILDKTGIAADPESMFDIQVKRIHEYKRQLLNALHAVTLYNRIKGNPKSEITPRTIIFGGKAAPGYYMAKLIIKLINDIADKINKDPSIGGRLKVVFLPNYCVSLAEKIIPAADLSEQISTAGTEASGTGNMKFSLNGAVIMGTLDGANIEMLEHVGKDNMFIFGLTIDEVNNLKTRGYNPYDYYNADAELKQALDMIKNGYFSPDRPDLYHPVVNAILNVDRYLVTADYRSFITAQESAAKAYMDKDNWARKSIMNTANMGYFSSDRAVMEYAEKIWGIKT